MGTYFTYGATRDDVIAEVAPEKTVSKNGQVFETLRKSLRGSTLYTLHRSTTPEGETKKLLKQLIPSQEGNLWIVPPVVPKVEKCLLEIIRHKSKGSLLCHERGQEIVGQISRKNLTDKLTTLLDGIISC